MSAIKTFKQLSRITAIALVSIGLVACVNKDKESGAIDFEKIPSGEAAQIARIAEQTTDLQDKRTVLPEQKDTLLRGVHPKSHGCVSAESIINPDIAKQYRVGLFANPGKKYVAQIRFSNASVKLAHDMEDGKNGSRGMAIKVFDVPGKFLESDGGRQNQDFLMINTPEFAFSGVRGYAFLTDALQASEHGNNADPLFALVLILAKINQTPPPFPEPTEEDLGKLAGFLASQNSQLPEGFHLTDLIELTQTLNIVLTRIQTRTVRNPLQVQYFGAAPFMFGANRVMKFSVAPVPSTSQPDFATPPNENYLAEALAQTMQGSGQINFDFKLQVRDQEADFGPDQLLIESATTTWDTSDKKEVDNYENVARLIIRAPQQTTTGAAKTACEKLVFTPWHSLAAHKPVGGINRLRRSVYYNSAKHRGAKAE
jgi:hypothetical protein